MVLFTITILIVLFQKYIELNEISSYQNTIVEPDSIHHTNPKEIDTLRKWTKWVSIIILNGLVIGYFVWATYNFVELCNIDILDFKCVIQFHSTLTFCSKQQAFPILAAQK